MLRQFRIASALLAAVITSAGCGIKGPLVLPTPKPAAVVAPAPPEPATTTPAAPLPAQGTAPAGERKP